jgi:hypothetical protein
MISTLSSAQRIFMKFLKPLISWEISAEILKSKKNSLRKLRLLRKEERNQNLKRGQLISSRAFLRSLWTLLMQKTANISEISVRITWKHGWKKILDKKLKKEQQIPNQQLLNHHYKKRLKRILRIIGLFNHNKRRKEKITLAKMFKRKKKRLKLMVLILQIKINGFLRSSSRNVMRKRMKMLRKKYLKNFTPIK